MSLVTVCLALFSFTSPPSTVVAARRGSDTDLKSFCRLLHHMPSKHTSSSPKSPKEYSTFHAAKPAAASTRVARKSNWTRYHNICTQAFQDPSMSFALYALAAGNTHMPPSSGVCSVKRRGRANLISPYCQFNWETNMHRSKAGNFICSIPMKTKTLPRHHYAGTNVYDW